MYSLLLLSLLPAQPVAEPPVVGRPLDWSGAVGGPFAVSWHAEPTELTAEEPLTLTLRIAIGPGGNAGNLRDLPRPVLAKLDSFKPFAVEDLDDIFADNPPRREFRYKLRPRSANVKQVPRFKFVYFNPRLPASRGYQTTYAEGVALTIKARATTATSQVLEDVPAWMLDRPKADEILGRNRGPVERWIDAALGAIGIKFDTAAPLRRAGLTWPAIGVLLSLPPAACGAWLLVWRRRNPTAARLTSIRRSRAATTALRALRAANANADREIVFLLDYLHERLGISATATTPADVHAALTRGGYPSDLISRTAALMRLFDAARFAPSGRDHASAATQCEQVILDWEASL